MAAGDTELLFTETTGNAKKQYWKLTPDGNSAITIATGFARIIGISWAWLEDIGATPTVPEFLISGTTTGNLMIRLANGVDIDKEMSVTITGF